MEPFTWSEECCSAIKEMLEDLKTAQGQQLPRSDTPKVVEIGALVESVEACCLTVDN